MIDESGPGKYDELCTVVRERAKARAAIVIVIDGEHGSGFSLQCSIADRLRLPNLLRHIAAQIDGDERRPSLN